MKLQLLAIPLLLALLVSPFFAMAATESVAFSSPTAGSSYSGTQAYTISGTISPAPTLPDNVAISVTNPNGQLVDQTSEAVQAGGSWTSYSTNVGGNSNWVSGTYTISVSDDTGPIGSTTFKYTSIPTTTTGALSVTAPSLVLPGQAANIFVWVSSPATVTGWYLAPGATTTTSLGSATRVSPNPGGLYVYTFSVTLSSSAANGAYLVGAVASNGTSGFSASNIGSFSVNGGVASSASVTALSSAIAAVNSAVSSLSNTVNSINSAVSGLDSSLSSIQSTLGTVSNNVQSLGSSLSTLSSTVNTIASSIGSISSSITTLTNDVSSMQTAVTSLSSLGSDMSSLQNSVSSLSTSVSNAQTYILVVAALAVITLVLELAILIRKMS
jgi:archaellum component FlaC